MSKLKTILKSRLSSLLYSKLLLWFYRPKPRYIRWGNLRRLTPVSRVFGVDRGLPVDRYYIESFLEKNRRDIRGRVLEIGDSTYTKKFGGTQVEKSEVLHIKKGNPQATIIANLETGDDIPSNKFDCLILTQTFPFIFDIPSAISNTYKTLAPGGVMLATLSGISQISRYDMDRWGDFWRFTDASSLKLFEPVFGKENLTITTHGNVLTSCAFLQGIATQELKKDELDYRDPDYQLVITVRAVKNR